MQLAISSRGSSDFLNSRSLDSNENPSVLLLGLLPYGPHGTWEAQGMDVNIKVMLLAVCQS